MRSPASGLTAPICAVTISTIWSPSPNAFTSPIASASSGINESIVKYVRALARSIV
ncbi:MAG: hypothetical protein M5U32_13895 [Myxococcota bacterium]|nr:hypothetical protein [Myxococcota bacterium]